ncbi:MAG: PAS domain-containing sensor histidine kinase [Thermoguttaceae bacterium]
MLGTQAVSAMSPDEVRSLICELRVRQIELQMQNDELHRAQEELTEARDRYFDLYEFAPVGYVTLGLDQSIEQCNLTAARMLGIDRSKACNVRLALFLATEDRDACCLAVRETLQLGARRSAEWAVAGGEGSIRFAHFEIAPMNEQSPVDGCLVTITDISDRKVAEQRLAATTQRLTVLMDALPVGVFFTDDPGCGRITGNPAFLAQFEAMAADNVSASAADAGALGRQIRYFGDGRLLGGSELPLQRAVAENRVIPASELEVLMPGGRRWYARVSAAPIRDGEKVIGGVAISEDVTERKRADEALWALTLNLERRVAQRTKALRMLHDVATMASQSQSTSDALRYCLEKVAAYHGWRFGQALLPAGDHPEELVSGPVWYPPESERFRRFQDAAFAARFRRGQGLVGRAFAGGKLEWSTELERDLGAGLSDLARQVGLRTAVAFPVVVDEKVAVVLQFFTDELVEAGDGLADAMAAVGLELGRVIERNRFEEHLLALAEDVQRYVAQDLHDDIGQELTGLGLKAATLVEILEPVASVPEELAADIAGALDRTYDKVRRLGRGMLPIELEEGMLGNALGQLAAATSEISQRECRFVCGRDEPVFDHGVSIHLYRIAQQAVAHLLRQGDARSLLIALTREGRGAVLRIACQGVESTGGAARLDGMGLRIMSYRASLIHGELQVGPRDGGGVEVVCRLATAAAPGDRQTEQGEDP